MVFRSLTGVKPGGLRAYNICLAPLLPIPAKTMEPASWFSCHHKIHTRTHSLFYECLRTQGARNLTSIAAHHLNTLSCTSADVFSRRAAARIPLAGEQAEARLPQLPEKPGRGRRDKLWFPSPAIHTSQRLPRRVPRKECKAKRKERIKKSGTGSEWSRWHPPTPPERPQRLRRCLGQRKHLHPLVESS